MSSKLKMNAGIPSRLLRKRIVIFYLIMVSFVIFTYLTATNEGLLKSPIRFSRFVLESQHAVEADPKMQFNFFPNIFSFLPHLLNKDPLISIVPQLLVQGKSKAKVVLGVPTAKRESQNYLLSTLKSLIDSMSQQEKNDSLIIVFVAETEDADFVKQLTKNVTKEFVDATESGLMEIISPPAFFYPNWNETFNNPPDWFMWRTKQNIDYALLMSYAQSRGFYYVQLEDDIICASGAVKHMIEFAQNQTDKKVDWFVLNFCQLGFIGKMFKSVDLPYLVQFAVMFHKDKPIDWFIDPLLDSRFCPNDSKGCQLKTEKSINYKPSLFQHMGTVSSLKGKIQNLKDNQFVAI